MIVKELQLADEPGFNDILDDMEKLTFCNGLHRARLQKDSHPQMTSDSYFQHHGVSVFDPDVIIRLCLTAFIEFIKHSL